MKLLRSVEEMRRFSESRRRQGLSFGFVPTMGALHEGHLSLVRRARTENDRVIASIFVNPLQFGPREDFGRYPRPLSRDRALCAKAGVAALFLPSPAQMYSKDFCTRVELGGLSDVLDGRFRPGHFQGVVTVVLKLFEIVRPDRAYFGEKDFQQLVIIRRMARDLNLPLEIVGCPTIREKDGLALSSRNVYLNPRERTWAPTLHQALALGAVCARRRPGAPSGPMLRAVRRKIENVPGVKIDYASLVDAETLQDAPRLAGRLRLLAAIRIGRTRLIDNIPIICKDRPSNGKS